MAGWVGAWLTDAGGGWLARLSGVEFLRNLSLDLRVDLAAVRVCTDTTLYI